MNLYAGARPDERFHTQKYKPFCMAFGFDDWLYRRVEWYNLSLPDGSPGRFSSYILLWFFRWYRGTAKADGSRTYAWQVEHPNEYVITTTSKEMLSVRLSYKRPDRERWDNQGGI